VISPKQNLYLTEHNNHNRQTSMPPAEFEPTIPAKELPQTHAIDGVAAGIVGRPISVNP
jgi:hypothetical protein